MLFIHFRKHKNYITPAPVKCHVGDDLVKINIDSVRFIFADRDEFDHISFLYPSLCAATRNCGYWYGDIACTILMNW